jgi:hypothetical protein
MDQQEKRLFDNQSKRGVAMYEIQNLVYLEALKEEKEREMERQRLQIKQVAQLPRASSQKKVSSLAVHGVELSGILRVLSSVAYGLARCKS